MNIAKLRLHFLFTVTAALLTVAAAAMATAQSPLGTGTAAASKASASAVSAASTHWTDKLAWNPDPDTVKTILAGCAPSGHAAADCFVSGMQSHGASDEAVAFARVVMKRTHGEPAYASEFTEGGRVAVAHVDYPTRSGITGGWYLVNGTPEAVDVDDLSLLPRAPVDNDLIAQELRRTFPTTDAFPEDRTDPSPALIPRPDGGQRFLVNYQLLDGCPTCEHVGDAEFTFDFGPDGAFQGTALMGVWMRKDLGNMIPIGADRDFYVHLLSNHASGYGWKLAGPLDEKIARFVSQKYLEPTGAAGTDEGVETWTFHSGVRGRAIIRLQNLLAGETVAPLERRFFFVVTVK